MGWQIKEGVILEVENEAQAILFDTNSLLTAWLNETSIVVFRGLEKGLKESQIVSEIMAVYEGSSSEEVSQDVETTVTFFKDLGVIESLPPVS